VTALTEAGFHVQLKHVSKKGSWDDHGWVKCTLGTSKGRLLASSDDLQHNPWWNQKEQKVAAFMKEMPAAASLTDAVSKTDSESDTAATQPKSVPSIAASVSSTLQAVAKLLTPRSRSKEPDDQNLAVAA